MRKHDTFDSLISTEAFDIIREDLYQIEKNLNFNDAFNNGYNTTLVKDVSEHFFYGDEKEKQAIKLLKWYKNK